MWSPRTGSPRRSNSRHLALWGALAVGWLLPSTGCQVEYAGMTLPSGKYMHDDVQYFPSGPDFPWANTQAATQRARMQAMGLEAAPGVGGPLVVPPSQGAIPPIQNQMGRPTDVNQGPMGAQPQVMAPGAAAPAVAPAGPAPAAVVPPPGGQPAVPPAPAGEAAAPPGVDAGVK